MRSRGPKPQPTILDIYGLRKTAETTAERVLQSGGRAESVTSMPYCILGANRGGRPEVTQLVSLSTEHVPPRERIRYWNDISGAALTPLVADPVERSTFSARLAHADLGTLKISEIHSDAAVIRHSKEHIALGREP